MLETHQAFDTIYTFFPLCVDILGNIGKYIRRVFMQCFGVEVFGSFFSVSAPTLIPQKERIPQQAQQDLCDTAPHHSGHTSVSFAFGWSQFPGDATLLQCCDSTDTVTEDTLEGFK